MQKEKAHTAAQRRWRSRIYAQGGRQFALTLTAADLDALESLAEKTGLSRAEAVRAAVLETLRRKG